jgi:lysophospholipase L1-like esterase
VSTEDIIAGHRQIIARVRSKGPKIYGATLLPFEGADF